jgi:hypothetical protein
MKTMLGCGLLVRMPVCATQKSAGMRFVRCAQHCDTGRNQEPVWVSDVDAVEITAQEGACYLDLSMTAKAADALTQVLDLLEAHAPHRIRDHVYCECLNGINS